MTIAVIWEIIKLSENNAEKKRVLFSFKGISKKGIFFLLHYIFFAVQSESEIRFWRSNL